MTAIEKSAGLYPIDSIDFDHNKFTLTITLFLLNRLQPTLFLLHMFHL